MAFTRFAYDSIRLKKHLQESTGEGRYILNTPGNGATPDYMSDPHIRLQKWGGNLMTNSIDIERQFWKHQISRDCNYHGKLSDVNSSIKSCPVNNMGTDQSRTTHPAHMYRNVEHTNWDIPLYNPQENIEPRFLNNLNTRILERDMFHPETHMTKSSQPEALFPNTPSSI